MYTTLGASVRYRRVDDDRNFIVGSGLGLGLVYLGDWNTCSRRESEQQV
jgi:hypothetical protein